MRGFVAGEKLTLPNVLKVHAHIFSTRVVVCDRLTQVRVGAFVQQTREKTSPFGLVIQCLVVVAAASVLEMSGK